MDIGTPTTRNTARRHRAPQGETRDGRSVRGTSLFFRGSLCLCWLLLPALVHAQSIGRVEQTVTNIGAYHKYVLPGTPTVLVQVLGTVRAPGLYELRADTDLGTLLALSGGPNLGPREESRKRKVSIRLYRPGTDAGPLYEAVLDEAILTPDRYPVLQDGDVLIVEVLERPGFKVRNVLRIANAVALITLAVDRIVRIANR